MPGMVPFGQQPDESLSTSWIVSVIVFVVKSSIEIHFVNSEPCFSVFKLIELLPAGAGTLAAIVVVVVVGVVISCCPPDPSSAVLGVLLVWSQGV